jgi:predicted  nucleic acid-binding Zn-ribbon protein
MAGFKGLYTGTTTVTGLALVATALIAVGAAGPPPSPLRVEVPVAAAGAHRVPDPVLSCTDERGEGFTSGLDDDGGFALRRALGEGASLCARARGPVELDERTGAIRALPSGSSLLVETRARQGTSQRMLVTGEQGEPRYQWFLKGARQPVDDAARAWLADALEVVASFREIGRIQGEVGSLQGQIGQVQGEIGALQGQIGRVQGEIGALQGRIGAIQGERGGLQGQIGSHQGAIGGLQGARWNASAAREQQIDREIAQHESEIRKLEAKLESSGFAQRLADAEAELAAFEKTAHERIAELEREIEGIRGEDRIAKLEKQIDDLHADDRIDAIKRRVAPAVERLTAQTRRLGS